MSSIPWDPELFAKLRPLAQQEPKRLQAISPIPDPPTRLAAIAGTQHSRLEDRGRAAISAGQLAICVLNGGMATRFGGPKGIASVLAEADGPSFLALKLAAARDVARTSGGDIPIVLMNSFATDDISHRHLESIEWAGTPRGQRHSFVQRALPRLDAETLEPWTPTAQRPEADCFAAAGHGSLLDDLVSSGTLTSLRTAGVRHLMVSNVDNVLADPDPIAFALHLQAVAEGAALTAEVAARTAEDRGGGVAFVPSLGRTCIVEDFRMPESLDPASVTHLNTNTLWIDLTALSDLEPLEYFAVRKQAGTPPRTCVQFEQLLGQLSEQRDAAYIEVERDARFLPIKTLADRDTHRHRLHNKASDLGLV